MKHNLVFIFFFLSICSFAQEEQVIIKTPIKEKPTATKIFYSQKVVNTKTVEVLPKGIMEFSVAHNFGDIGGDGGGIERFYGLDNASDIRIGFQAGITDKLDLIASRTRGGGFVQNQWELGAKYQVLHQVDNDAKHPLSLTIFANNVISTQKSSRLPQAENYFEELSDRLSQVVQVMIARKFGKVSLQLNPLFLNTSHVIPNDDKSMFALGGAIRFPISKKVIFHADYFHSFRSESSEDYFKTLGINFYDPLGVGIEILTEGHVFHINFTNSTDILENRFIRRTVTSWGNGEFRWAFIISRNFVVFKPKK